MAVEGKLGNVRRRRELASSDRSGRYARDLVRGRVRAMVRRAWKPLMGLLVLVPLGFVPAAMTYSSRAAWFVMGGAVATAVWLDVLVVLLMSGALGALDGLQAEQATVGDLKRMRRKGWRLVNGLMLLERSDIDHVAIGPAGVLVVETKHSEELWPVGVSGRSFMQERLRDASEQVRKNAWRVAQNEPFRRAIGTAPVRPVLVVHSSSWEPQSGPGWTMDRDVVIIQGTHLASWLSQLEGGALDPAGVDRIWNELSDHISRRDGSDEARVGPRRLTASQFYRRVLLGAPAGFLAGVQIEAWAVGTFGVPGFIVATMVSVGFGLWMRRFPAVRWAAGAWLLACAAFTVLLVLLIVKFEVFS